MFGGGEDQEGKVGEREMFALHSMSAGRERASLCIGLVSTDWFHEKAHE